MAIKEILKKGVEKFKKYNSPEEREKRINAEIKRQKSFLALESVKQKRQEVRQKNIDLFEKRQEQMQKKSKARNPFELL